MWYSYTESTFSILDRLLDEIKNYIGDFKGINSNKNDMHTQAYLIIENFIRDEISGLDYDWKKINVFSILFAFFLSLIFVYISGDIFVTMIKWIANYMGFGNFKFIRKLNAEGLALLILFPLSIAFSKDIVISSLKERNKLLRRSLAIIERNIELNQRLI